MLRGGISCNRASCWAIATRSLTFWWPFFICFLILFLTTGIGNGSTIRSIPYIFTKEKAGPVLGWASAIAAYGAFVIPKVFGQQIISGTPEKTMYGFAIYYLICLLLNWWYYERKKYPTSIII